MSRHVDTIVRELSRTIDARVLGSIPGTELNGVTWREVLERARSTDVVWHAHRVNELIAGLSLRALRPRVRVVFTRHSLGQPSSVTAALARRADRLIAVSEEVAKDLEIPCSVVPHGVPLDVFTPPSDRSTAFHNLELGGSFGIGVIGRVRPDKGQGDFAAAIRPLLPDFPQWKAVLVGLVKPADRPWAESLGVPLRDETHDVARWYRGLSVVVVPSHAESFGLVRAEAMAAGCCLVTTRLNSFDARIEHGKTGFVVPPKDVPALAKILRGIMERPALAAEVGAAASAFARRELGVDREAQALLQVYEEAFSARPPAPR